MAIVAVAGLLIDAGEHQKAVHCPDGPAFVHEIRCEVIEKQGVAGRVAAKPEIIRSCDESESEMVEPDAVDHDSGCERVFPAGDCLGELKPPAAMLE